MIHQRPGVYNKMQQIKLLEQPESKYETSQGRFIFEETVSPSKRKNIEHLQLIQPWMEDVDSNPFLNFKSKQFKKRESPKFIKRQSSLNLAKNWKSTEKIVVNRQSKILPVMDIGKLNTIRKASYSTSKIKSKVEINSRSTENVEQKILLSPQKMLPSVQRQLMIERKIFLMKSVSQNSSPFSSPIKQSKIRNIISSARY